MVDATANERQNLIINGGFEDNPIGESGFTNTTADKVSGWKTSTGRIQVQESNYGSGNAVGDALVELNSYTGELSQNVNITQAGSYSFSLNHSSRAAQGGTLSVVVDGVVVKVVDVQRGNFQRLELDLELSAGAHEIRLIGDDGGVNYLGVTVDDISLTKNTAPAPQPEAADSPAVDQALAAADVNNDLVVNDGTLEFSNFTFTETATSGDKSGISDGKVTGSTFNDGLNFTDFSAFAAGPNSRVDAKLSYTVKQTDPLAAIQQIGTQFNISVDIEGENVSFGANGPSRDLGDIQAQLIHSVYAINEDGSKGALVGSVTLDVRSPDFRDPPYEDADFLLEGSYRELMVETQLILDTKTTDANLTLSVIENTYDSGEIPGSLSGTYFCDEDKDGVDDGAAAGDVDIAGKKVELFQADGKTPVTDFDGNPVAAVTTDANGNYRFDNLRAGDYVVKFEDSEAEGKSFIDQNVGNDDAIDSDADPSTGVTAPVKVFAGQETPNVDVGIEKDEPTEPTNPDNVELCEDKTETFNVFDNDGADGLKLISVKHENYQLDTLFQRNGGSLTFDEDGNVTYTGMTNYYGFDKLVYTAVDANGTEYTETVDVTLNAASDAKTPAAVAYHPGGWAKPLAGGDYAHKFNTLFDIKINDDADKLQQFGTYNKGVADDRDEVDSVILTGVNRDSGWIVYKGERLSFDNGQEHEIPFADIEAGLLQLEFVQPYYVEHTLSWRYKDTGESGGHCDNVNESTITTTTIHTPIALDLNGDNKIGVTGETTSYDKSGITTIGKTVEFDIDADGDKDVIEWLSGDGDAFLFDNRDGNAINDMNGSRLFGDADGHANGYEKLAELDIDGDGMLRGSELNGLQLWADNGDAVMTEDEMISLSDMGVVAISSEMQLVKDDDGRDLMRSVAELANGEQMMTEDVWFM